MTTYFAYGSNLNHADWHAWCNANGYASDLLQPLGVARLLDYRLAFSRRSVRRGGGALNVLPTLGHVVEGMLFQVAGDEGWAALDKKEGAPRWYQRTPVFVQQENGEISETMTYIVHPEFCESFVIPAAGYAELVRDGLLHWGLGSEALDTAAQNLPAAGLVNRLFCYGTLMQGECRFPILKQLGFTTVSPATTRGQLFNLGPYPALVTATNDDGIVHGELFSLTDPPIVLKRLDEVEGFDHHGSPVNLYSRRLLKIESVSARLQWAWGYCSEKDLGGFPIESGCWRTEPPNPDFH